MRFSCGALSRCTAVKLDRDKLSIGKYKRTGPTQTSAVDPQNPWFTLSGSHEPDTCTHRMRCKIAEFIEVVTWTTAKTKVTAIGRNVGYITFPSMPRIRCQVFA